MSRLPSLLALSVLFAASCARAPVPLPTVALKSFAAIGACDGAPVAVTRDGRRIAVGCADGRVLVFGIDQSEPGKVTLVGQVTAGLNVGEVAFHPSGDLLFVRTCHWRGCTSKAGSTGALTASPNSNEVLMIVALPRRGPLRTLTRLKLDGCPSASGLTLAHEGWWLAMACNAPGFVQVYDVDPSSPSFGALVHSVDRPINSDGTSPDEAGPAIDIALGNEARAAWVVTRDVHEGPNFELRNIDFVQDKGSRIVQIKNWGGAPRISIGPDGGHAFTTFADGKVQRTTLGKELQTLTLAPKVPAVNAVSAVALGTGRVLSVSSDPARVTMTDFSRNRIIVVDAPIFRDLQPVAMAANADGSLVAVRTSTGSVLAFIVDSTDHPSVIPKFILEDPCAEKTVLRWSVPGGVDASLTTARGGDATKSDRVASISERPVGGSGLSVVTRYQLRARMEWGYDVAVAIHAPPGSEFHAALCPRTK